MSSRRRGGSKGGNAGALEGLLVLTGFMRALESRAKKTRAKRNKKRVANRRTR